jgi:transposase
MATIQSKMSRGHKYWYIVESRRVNGKPRPVVLAYLGKATDLLSRLQGLTEGLKIKSFSHGGVGSLLQIAKKLDVAIIINKYVHSSRTYISEKPVRNGLTAGITLLLGAIGRVCMPTSKRGWWNWAKTTSIEYLLHCNLKKIDSQHFWDLMDCLPEENIEKVEEELLKNAWDIYKINDGGSLFYDTTNFFTFIDTSNDRCQIAQRGKNKQKRSDLRQVGMALVVTQKDYVPLFHHAYQGNLSDVKVFQEVIVKIKNRISALNLDPKKHTIVFDRGNNSKDNLQIIKNLGLNYVAALTPYHHKQLIDSARKKFQKVEMNGQTIDVFRVKREIWGQSRTVIVFISDRLREGQIRGVYQALEKNEKQLAELQQQLQKPRAIKRKREELEKKIRSMTRGQYINEVIQWELKEVKIGKFILHYSIDQQKIQEVEDSLGFRIIMTNHHKWKTEDIIKTYYGQSVVENAFKNIKNPYHLALRPQFHWTDQKIKVHYLICIIGYLLATLAWREVKMKCGYSGSLDNFISLLNNIRLATILEESTTRGRIKAHYKLEETNQEEKKILQALEIDELHMAKLKINGVGVYN